MISVCYEYLSQEYEHQETAESRFVKDLDRLDMVVQAYEYEQQERRPGFLQEFFDSTQGQYEYVHVGGGRGEKGGRGVG